MYIKYQVLKAERKSTSTGKDKMDVDLQDFNGVVEEKVTIWADFPNFTSIKTGSEVCGQITVKNNGQYVNKTLYPERTEGFGGKKGAPSVNMNKIMEKKQEGIAVAQDNKELGIKVSSSMNKAIDLAIAESKEFNSIHMVGQPTIGYDLKAGINKWRQWIWDNWDEIKSQPPF